MFAFASLRHAFRFLPVVSVCALAMMVMTFVAPSPVLAQNSDMQILLDRMERMARDIRTLNQQIARGGDPASAPPVSSSTPSSAPEVEFTQNEGALARVHVRLSALEQEVRQATGAAESMTFRVEQLSARLDKLMSDLEFRLSRLEGGATGTPLSAAGRPPEPMVRSAPSTSTVSNEGAMAPLSASEDGGRVDENGTYVPADNQGGSLGQVSKNTLDSVSGSGDSGAGSGSADTSGTQDNAQVEPPSPQSSADTNTQTASVLPQATPREQYQHAFSLMGKARYGEAEMAFKAFLEQHPGDDLAGNARYWLGESYYVRKSYMDAAQTFFQAYQVAPDGPKAPDSLLKLGMSMANLDKSEEACATYSKLRKEFSNLKSSIEKNLNREVKRLNCK